MIRVTHDLTISQMSCPDVSPPANTVTLFSHIAFFIFILIFLYSQISEINKFKIRQTFNGMTEQVYSHDAARLKCAIIISIPIHKAQTKAYNKYAY